MKNFELVNIVNILDSYSNYKLPQKISYAITRNMIALQGDVECYSKMLSNIIEKYKDYIVKDNDGNDVINSLGIPDVDSEHIEDYTKDLNELMDFDIDATMYYINFDEFDYNGEKYDLLSASDIMRLQEVLCDTNDTKGDSDEKAD